ncbi:MAG: nucleotidyltransferase family protein, partial [Bacteroidales bacterium]|nr:nucleotidyltransferase family protein [Bacteroidales bacterium]
MKRSDEILLALLRRALWREPLPKNKAAQMPEQVGHDGDKKQGNGEHTPEQGGHDQCQEGWHEVDKQQWQEIYQQASYQGVLGVLWDGVKDLPMDKGLRLNWALNVEKIEQRYEHQRIVLEELAELFAANGMDMMVIKGYGLSLLYPEPKHRPCGDIDFYLYGEYAKGDKVLEETHNLTTDLNKHHHTV